MCKNLGTVNIRFMKNNLYTVPGEKVQKKKRYCLPRLITEMNVRMFGIYSQKTETW